jgi:hypothetical protein
MAGKTLGENEMKNKRLISASAAALLIFTGITTNASAGATSINAEAMRTQYAVSSNSTGQNDERNWIVAAARVVYAAGTRAIQTRAVQGALAYVAGEVIGRAIGGRAIEQLEAPDTISTVFD